MASNEPVKVPADIYDSGSTEPAPAAVHPQAVGSASRQQSQTKLVPVATIEDDSHLDAEPKPGSSEQGPTNLTFKEIATRVRRRSTESIGDADDLLNPSSAAAKPADGLDEPDFWDKMSQFTVRMRKDWLYFFQHPYARIFIAYLVTLCNFLIYAEDPVAHSDADCNIVFVGNVYSFVVTKYPPNGFSVLKVFLWLVAILVGLIVGKLVVHKLLLKRLLKLQMFQDDMGSFMVMFIVTLISLFIFSWLYNAFLLLGGEAMKPYAINGYMTMRNSTFMKAAACGTWLGDFFTAWMVTDVMLQEKFYPEWAKGAKAWWNRGYHRVILFWCMAAGATLIVVTVIATDGVRWDDINAKILASNELSRAFLASFILVMDLLIVMQDWDFPHFINHFDIKLPGLNTADFKITLPQCLNRLEAITIHITGKWFNYGIIFLVMILDLNMWKNQIFYEPALFAQTTDNETGFIYSYRANGTLLRPEGVELDNSTTYDLDRMESRFLDFPLPAKATAIIPSLAAFIVFFVLIFIFGRIKRTKANPYAGRLVKVPKTEALSMYTIVKMKLWGKRKVDGGKAHKGATQDETPKVAANTVTV